MGANLFTGLEILLNDDQFKDLDEVVEHKNWIRTVRDPVWIDKIVDEAIQENPKLVRKFLKTKSQKTLDVILQVSLTLNIFIMLQLVSMIIFRFVSFLLLNNKESNKVRW